MEKYYKEQIQKCQIKQELMRLGIQELISKKADLDYIQKCFEVLKEEQNTQRQCEEYLQKEISGENEKRAEAKRRLGIGG